MRVLLVAPRKNELNGVDAEVQDILRSGLDVTPRIGKVGANDLLSDVREGNYDVLWLATHGNNDHIELSGTELITVGELVPLVRGRFNLVVLNTCNGLGVAQAIQEEANVSVICSLLSIPDTSAYKFGSRLSSALVESSSIASAYLASRPGRNESYLYLPAILPTQTSVDSLLLEMRGLKSKLEDNVLVAAVAAAEVKLLRRLLWASLGLHIPEWIVLLWMWLDRAS